MKEYKVKIKKVQESVCIFHAKDENDLNEIVQEVIGDNGFYFENPKYEIEVIKIGRAHV